MPLYPSKTKGLDTPPADAPASDVEEKPLAEGESGTDHQTAEKPETSQPSAGDSDEKNGAARQKPWGRRVADRIKPILDKIVSVLSSDSINEAFFNITEDIQEIMGCEAVRVYSIDPNARQLYSRNFVSDVIPEFRLDISKKTLAGYVAGTGQPVILSDVSDPKAMAQYPGLKHDPHYDKKLNIKTRSAMVLPLMHGTKTLGVLEFVNKQDEGHFTDQEFELAKDVAKSMGTALEKLEQEDTDQKLRAIAVAIHRASVVEDALDEIRQPILELFQAKSMTLYDLDTANNEIYSKFLDNELKSEIRLSISSESIAGWVAQEKRMVNIRDAYNADELRRYHPDLTFDTTWDKKTGTRTKSMLVCPLIFENRVMGVLQLINKRNGEEFQEHDEKNIVTLAELLGISFYNHKKFVELKPQKFSYLLNQGLITTDELTDATAKARSQGVDVEKILLDDLGLKREDIGKSLENFYEVPYYGYDPTIILPSRCFAGLNRNFLVRNHWVPVEVEASKVVILIDDPTNADKTHNIRQIFRKKKLEFRVGLQADIRDFLNASAVDDGGAQMISELSQDEGPTEEIASLLDALRSEKEETVTVDTQEEEESGAISDSDSTIVRLVNKIIVDAYDRGVSDIHIEPGTGRSNLRVRYRKDGECALYEEIPSLYKQPLISRIKIMAKLDIAEKRLPQDGKIKMKYGHKEIELRVATLPTVGSNEDVVLRILAANKVFSLDSMNFSERNINLLKSKIVKPYGLVLCVGPTGSGKTTTLHAALGFINTPKKKIWTAEDPVEITQPGLRQMQMHDKIGLNFARALRSFLRGDPDVIMVGEMRDEETCTIGLEASLTGHLVFSTLHTNSAPETITRLLDMGMNPLNFSDALLLIVAQRLVKTLCKECKESYHPTREEFDLLVEEYGKDDFPHLGIEYNKDLKLWKSVGCSKCDKTGYSGRTGLHELLDGTPEMKTLIMKKALMDELRVQAIKDGMTTLKQDGIWKVFKGDCDLKQVLAVCMV